MKPLKEWTTKTYDSLSSDNIITIGSTESELVKIQTTPLYSVGDSGPRNNPDWDIISKTSFSIEHDGESIELSFNEFKRLKEMLRNQYPEDYL